MKKILLASALYLFFGSAQAVESVRWDSASLSDESADIHGETLTGSGISQTQLLGDHVFIEGSYRDLSNHKNVSDSRVKLNLNALSLGTGYRHALSKRTDVFSMVLYEELEYESSFGDGSENINENSFGIDLGIRSLLTQNVELRGSVSYLEVSGKSKITSSYSAMFHFTNKFSTSIGFSNIDEADFLSLSGVVFF